MRQAILVVLCIALASAPKLSFGDEVMTGADVLGACSIASESWISFCHGYVQSTFDAYHQANQYICVPPGTTRATLAGAVTLRLSASPELGSLRGSEAVARALAVLYPC